MFQRAVANDSRHRSAHLYLGVAYRTQGYRVQAILAFLRFLALEPEGQRAQGAATEVLNLLDAGFSQTGEAEYEIQLNLGQKTDEGDYGPAELVRALGGSVVVTDEWKDRPAGEKLVYRIDSVLAAVDEGTGPRQDFARSAFMPFLRALRERELLEAFVHSAFAPVGPPELGQWVEQHPGPLGLLRDFLEGR
jgi:hypothetical protein